MGRNTSSEGLDTNRFYGHDFQKFLEQVERKGELGSLMTHSRADAVVLASVFVDLWCGGFNFREELFVDSLVYQSKDIEF